MFTEVINHLGVDLLLAYKAYCKMGRKCSFLASLLNNKMVKGCNSMES